VRLQIEVPPRVLRSTVIGRNHDGVGAIVEVVDLMLSRLTRLSAGTSAGQRVDGRDGWSPSAEPQESGIDAKPKPLDQA
jgi:hypothetical protein